MKRPSRSRSFDLDRIIKIAMRAVLAQRRPHHLRHIREALIINPRLGDALSHFDFIMRQLRHDDVGLDAGHAHGVAIGKIGISDRIAVRLQLIVEKIDIVEIGVTKQPINARVETRAA